MVMMVECWRSGGGRSAWLGMSTGVVKMVKCGSGGDGDDGAFGVWWW